MAKRRAQKTSGSPGEMTMRPSDVRKLIRFNHRMSMFVWSPDRWTIVAFLHGYEYGTSNKCRFTDVLSAYIAKQYHVKADALGWQHQIGRFAECRSLEWNDAYLLISSEVLNAALGSTIRDDA